MKVRYVGSRPRDVSPAGHESFIVQPGDVVDVPDKVGRALLRQVRWWKKAAEPKKTEK